jgi:hypothetical protein
MEGIWGSVGARSDEDMGWDDGRYKSEQGRETE